MSLNSEANFGYVLNLLENPVIKVVIWGVLSALAYHFSAGVKHLFMDIGYGETLETGPLFAKITITISTILVILAGVWVW